MSMTSEQATQFVIEMRAIIEALCLNMSTHSHYVPRYKRLVMPVNELLDEEKYNQLIDLLQLMEN